MSETDTSPETPFPQRTMTKERRMLVFLVIGSLLLLTLGGIAIHYVRPEKTPFSNSQARAIKKLPFGVYYPERLPQGYALDLRSLSISGNVVSYIIEDGQNAKLYFSFQPLPDRSTIDNLFAGKSDRATIGTPLGQATTAFVSNRQIASIVLDDTWLIISTVDPVEKPTLLAILEHMRRF